MDAFEAYTMFLAVRAHFNQAGYNYFMYNGKVRTNYDKFMQRKDRHFFHKLSKKEDPLNYVVASFLEDSTSWITNIIGQEGEDRYVEWKRRTDSMMYNFEKDVSRMDDDFNSNFTVEDGQYPKLLESYLEGDTSPETILVFDSLLGIMKDWDRRIEDTAVWPGIRDRLNNYRDFLKLDDKKDRAKSIILKKFSTI